MVSSLLAPVIVTLGQQNGLIVPLIAVHLFVFYFGIMADVTPAGGAGLVRRGRRLQDPIKTGITAFCYTACAPRRCRSCSSSTPICCSSTWTSPTA